MVKSKSTMNWSSSNPPSTSRRIFSFTFKGSKIWIRSVLKNLSPPPPPFPSTKQQMISVLWIRIQIRSDRHHFAGSGPGSVPISTMLLSRNLLSCPKLWLLWEDKTTGIAVNKSKRIQIFKILYNLMRRSVFDSGSASNGKSDQVPDPEQHRFESNVAATQFSAAYRPIDTFAARK